MYSLASSSKRTAVPAASRTLTQDRHNSLDTRTSYKNRAMPLAPLLALLLMVFINSVEVLDQHAYAQKAPASGIRASLDARYLTYISTDKPTYLPGEIIRVRGMLFHALDRTPFSSKATAAVELRSDNGAILANVQAETDHGQWHCEFHVSQALSAQDLSINASYPGTRMPDAEQALRVTDTRDTRLNLTWSYRDRVMRQGQTALAIVSVRDNKQEGVSEALLYPELMVDGKSTELPALTTTEGGTATFEFKLPKVEEGELPSLLIRAEHDRATTSAMLPVPIVEPIINAKLFGEMGYLVEGVENQVYLTVHDKYRRPLETALTLSSDGEVVANFKTDSRGFASGKFTPMPGKEYSLGVRGFSAKEVKSEIEAAARDKPLLAVRNGVIAFDDSFRGTFAAQEAGKYQIRLQRLDRKVASADITSKKAESHEFELDLQGESEFGVMKLSLYQGAEYRGSRLVYRHAPESNVQLSLEDYSREVPAEQDFSFTLVVRDAKGNPLKETPVAVSIAAAESYNELAQDARTGPLEFRRLLEHESYRYHAPTPLLQSYRENWQALDTMLGVQRWREDAFTPKHRTFLKTYGERASRVDARKPAKAESSSDEDGYRSSASPTSAAGSSTAPKGDFSKVVRNKEYEKIIRRKRERQNNPRPDNDDQENDDEAPSDQPRIISRNVLRILSAERDDPDTIFYQPAMLTDSRGRVRILANAGNRPRRFRLHVEAWTDSGEVNELVRYVDVIRPIEVNLHLPRSFVVDDEYKSEMRVTNHSSRERRIALSAELDNSPFELLSKLPDSEKFDAGETKSFPIRFRVTSAGRTSDFVLRASSEGDEHRLAIPARLSWGGVEQTIWNAGVAGDGEKLELELPRDTRLESVNASISIQPSLGSTLLEGTAALIRRPTGCFEQTISVHYPLVMAHKYLSQLEGTDPELLRLAAGHIRSGHAHLNRYRSSKGGYTWFTSSCGDSSIWVSSYALRLWLDSKDIIGISQAEIDRLAEFVYENRPKVDTDTRTASIYWSLSLAGYGQKISNELQKLAELAMKSKDPYYIACVSCALSDANMVYGSRASTTGGKTVYGSQIENRLADQISFRGKMDGRASTPVQSGGISLSNETVAMAVRAWIKSRAARHYDKVKDALAYLRAANRQGHFGSTQATVLALGAICLAERQGGSTMVANHVRVQINGEDVAELDIARESLDLPSIENLMKHWKKGKNIVRFLDMKGKALPYSMNLTYITKRTLPKSDSSAVLDMDLKLSKLQASEGEAVTLEVTMNAKGGEKVNAPIADIGLPAGLRPDVPVLDAMVRAGHFADYELYQDRLVLYWESFEGNSRGLEIPCRAVAQGTFTSPASSAYPYYHEESRKWERPLKIKVKAAKDQG